MSGPNSILFLVFAAAPLLSQPTPAQQPKSGPDRQRAAVARQSGASGSGFFTAEWSASLSSPEPGPALHGSSDCDALPEAELTKLAFNAAESEGINPALLRAVIKQESGGKPCAVSPKGAQGLMQLMPGTQDDLAVEDPFDPAQNVSGGARYLKQMLTRFKGDLAHALAAYNAGPEAVEAARGVPNFAETKNYVSSILAVVNAASGGDTQ